MRLVSLLNQVETITEFKRARYEEQMLYVGLKGIFLFRKKEKGFEVKVYIVPGYYVEVWIDRITNDIIKFEAFTQKENLDSYLDDIDISSFY